MDVQEKTLSKIELVQWSLVLHFMSLVKAIRHKKKFHYTKEKCEKQRKRVWRKALVLSAIALIKIHLSTANITAQLSWIDVNGSSVNCFLASDYSFKRFLLNFPTKIRQMCDPEQINFLLLFF